MTPCQTTVCQRIVNKKHNPEKFGPTFYTEPKFLTAPIPKSMGIVGCTMWRSRSKHSVQLFLQRADGESVFIMSARKTIYGFSIRYQPPKCRRVTRTQIARVKSLDYRRQYNVSMTTGIKQSTGCICFTRDKGRRKTALVIPDPDNKTIRGVREFENVPPQYTPDRGFTTDFNGRTVVTSTKNTVVNSGRDRIWLVGKAGADQFNLDMAWPLSPVQAFAFGIGALDTIA